MAFPSLSLLSSWLGLPGLSNFGLSLHYQQYINEKKALYSYNPVPTRSFPCKTTTGAARRVTTVAAIRKMIAEAAEAHFKRHFLPPGSDNPAALAAAIDNCKQRVADASACIMSNEERAAAKARAAADRKAIAAANQANAAATDALLKSKSEDERLEWYSVNARTPAEAAAAAAAAAAAVLAPEKSPREREEEKFQEDWAAMMQDPEMAAKVVAMQAKA